MPAFAENASPPARTRCVLVAARRSVADSVARLVVLLLFAAACRTRPLEPFGITAIDGGRRDDGDGGSSPAESDHALLCDGVDDEISIDLAAQWMPEFTIEMWFRGDNIPTTSTTGEFILYAPSSKPLEPSLSVAFESPETIDFSYLNQCSTMTGDQGLLAATSAQQWHHFAATLGPSPTGADHQLWTWIDGGVRNLSAAMPSCTSTVRVLLCRAPPSEFPAAVPFTGVHGRRAHALAHAFRLAAASRRWAPPRRNFDVR